eukprot:COSAG02_NODE_1378_length_12990_cov_3.643705_10_plen_256_part_00
MGERPAPLVPYSVFKRQGKTSLPVGWHLDRARHTFSTCNMRQQASPHAEHRKTTQSIHQQQDRDINVKKQQLEHLRQIVAKLELEVGARDGPSPPATTTPACPAGPALQHVPTSAAVQPALRQGPQEPEKPTQAPTKQEANSTGGSVSRAFTGGVDAPTPMPTGLDKHHHKPEASKQAIMSVQTATRRPRSERQRRRSLEHTPGWEHTQRQARQVAPVSLPVASSGGRGQQPRKHNRSRSRRSSMPSVMGFGRFV